MSIRTDLAISGKVAQFGGGVLSDVSARLMNQFVGNLERLTVAVPTPSAQDTEAEAGPTQVATRPEPAALDLLTLVGGRFLLRLVPVAAVLALVVWAGVRWVR